MKTIKSVFILVLCSGLLFSNISCAVLVKSDNGKHKGWYKIRDKPQHDNSKNPGKQKGHKKKSAENVNTVYVVEILKEYS